MSVNIIYPGTTVRLRGIFKDASGITINPSTIILKIQSPDGAITPYTGLDLENQGVGIWAMSYIPQNAGRYTVQWLTDNPDVVGQGYFDVKPLAF
jgi:hypothetical protein